MLDIADRRKILIHPLAIMGTKTTIEAIGILQQCIQYAASFFKSMQLSSDLIRTALHKHPPKQSRRAVFSGKQYSVACPRQTSIGFINVDAQIQRGESSHRPQFFGGELIQ